MLFISLIQSVNGAQILSTTFLFSLSVALAAILLIQSVNGAQLLSTTFLFSLSVALAATVAPTLRTFIYLFIYSLFIIDSFTIEHIHI